MLILLSLDITCTLNSFEAVVRYMVHDLVLREQFTCSCITTILYNAPWCFPWKIALLVLIWISWGYRVFQHQSEFSFIMDSSLTDL